MHVTAGAMLVCTQTCMYCIGRLDRSQLSVHGQVWCWFSIMTACTIACTQVYKLDMSQMSICRQVWYLRL